MKLTALLVREAPGNVQQGIAQIHAGRVKKQKDCFARVIWRARRPRKAKVAARKLRLCGLLRAACWMCGSLLFMLQLRSVATPCTHTAKSVKLVHGMLRPVRVTTCSCSRTP